MFESAYKKIFIFPVVIIFAVVIFVCSDNAEAAINKQINYQGKLTNSSNVSAPDGNYDMVIRIYDSASGGNCLWSARGNCGAPQARTVALANGIFSIMLGDTGAGDNALNLDFNSTYYLGIKIGTDTEMAPRKILGASAYAFNASLLNGLTSATSGADAHIVATDSSGNLTVSGNAYFANGTTYKVDNTGNGNLNGLTLAGNAAINGGGITSTGALTITPNAGTNLNVALSGTGDFAVNTNQLYVDTSTGNIGIGTSSPGQPLTLALTDTKGIALADRSTNGTVYIGRTGAGAFGGNDTNIGFYSSGTTSGDIKYNSYAGSHIFSISRSEKMRIDSAGNIGIGTANPVSKLHVYGTTASDVITSDIGINFSSVATPSLPSLALVASAGNLGIGNYRYTISVTTALGESNSPTADAVITTTAGNQQVDVSWSAATDYRATGYKIYRTKLNGNNWETFLLATINGVGTTSYRDNIADASLTGSSGIGTYHINTTNKQITLNGSRAMVVDAKLTSLGIGAGANITAGGDLTLIGYNAGTNLTTGMETVVVGNNSFTGATSGWGNTVMGYNSATATTTGGANTAIGHRNMMKNQTGSNNVTVGLDVAYGTALNSFNENTFIGTNSAYTITTGSQNTFLGRSAGYNLTSGSYNVFLGYKAGYYETGSSKLIIDSLARADEATGRSSALIYGVTNATPANQILALGGGGSVGIGTIAPGYVLDVQHATSKINSKNGYLTNGADYAEYFYTTDTDLKSGEVVCVDKDRSNSIKRCVRNGDNDVMGIVSTNPSIVGNGDGKQRENDENYKVIGMLGQVPGKVNAENGPIEVGDNLTAASVQGYMRKANAGESTVGVALEELNYGNGQIQILISRRNQSLTVEKVEEAVMQNIAAMNIEDQVNNLVSSASSHLDEQISSQEIVLNDMKLKMADFDSMSANLALQMKKMQADVNPELINAKIDLNSQEISLIKQVMGIDRVSKPGDMDVLGLFSAKGVQTGKIIITNNDIKKRVIGNSQILSVKNDADNDGKDDDTQSDGKSVFIKTNDVKKEDKIYITPVGSTGNQVPYVDNIKEDEGFEIRFDAPIENDVNLNWWIIESVN